MITPKYVPREYISVSTLMKFIRCPRLYFYIKSGLVSKEEAPALDYGKAMHKAVPIAMARGLDEALAAFESIWKGREVDDKRNSRRARLQLSHFAHSHGGGRSIYTFERPPANPGIELAEETSEFEVPAVLDVGLPIPLVVQIDGLVKHRDTNELWGWEFKTTSRLNASLFENMEMNPQILTYTLALRTLTGTRVKGMMAEAMLIDKSKVDNMTHLIQVEDHHLESIKLWLRFYAMQLLACEKKYSEIGAEAFVKNFAGCSAYPQFYMPSWMCDYANLCRVENWENLISLYDVREDHKFIKLTNGVTNGTA